MPKYGQKSTFDRKIVVSPFYRQNVPNGNLKRSPYVRGHFALKRFLYAPINFLKQTP